jgi:hypothetical protein
MDEDWQMFVRGTRGLALGLALVGALASSRSIAASAGLTWKSPEVIAAAEKGARYLATTAKDDRVGAQALIGLAILTQTGSADHPKITECAENIRKALSDRKDGLGAPYGHWLGPIYSAGLAIIFLVQCDDYKANGPHAGDISTLLEYMRSMQKGHGGWGYAEKTTGDTSMTQYGVLSAWEASHAGFHVSTDAMERVANWLLSTQDPSGGFGYQGTVGDPTKLVAQTEVKHSMTAAGLGSLYVCDNLLKLTDELRKPPDEDDTPPGLKEIKPDQGPQKPAPRFDPRMVQEAEERGNGWFDANFKAEVGQYNYYYLYAYERYRSFREEVEHAIEENPQWYSEVAEFILSKQNADGSWGAEAMYECGRVPDTAFAVLFLLRSTRRHLDRVKTLNGGRMVTGKGIPKDTAHMDIDPNGHLVTKPREDPAEALLKALEDKENKDPDKTAELLAQLPDEKLEALSTKDAAAIRKLVSNKLASTRMVAVRALCRTPRDLDNVPVLIYALSDPDPDIAREANDGLRRIARSPWDSNPTGKSPSDIRLSASPSDEERRKAIEDWKAWYRSIRPSAEVDL